MPFLGGKTRFYCMTKQRKERNNNKPKKQKINKFGGFRAK